jgi:hypothetical protein
VQDQSDAPHIINKNKKKRCNIKSRPTWKRRPHKKRNIVTLYKVATAAFGPSTPEENIIISKPIDDPTSQVTPLNKRQEKRLQKRIKMIEQEVILLSIFKIIFLDRQTVISIQQ